jgi:hypothetical protein
LKRKVIALLLVVHGLISSIFMFYIENPPEPGVGWNGNSWILTGILDSSLIQIIGTLLWGLTVLLFVSAGITVFMKRVQWRLIDILAALVSLLAYILFWNGLEPVPEYWILGPIISVVTLVALVIVRWPPDEWIFSTSVE